MKTGFFNLVPVSRWSQVLFGSLFLGVVGLQVVHIAHTHNKMITGQPLLLGQDHHDLSHLPPLFLPIARFATFSNRFLVSTPHDAAIPSDPPVTGTTGLDDGWDSMVIIPFVSLSDDGDCYVILMDAPDLCPSNIEITLCGRELAISSRTFSSNINASGVVQSKTFWERRIRFPGPVSTTGPPKSEFSASGRLRISMPKAEIPPTAKETMSQL
jgi:hypothetical protein